MSGKSGSRLSFAAKATAGQFAYEPVRRRTRPTVPPSALDDAHGCAAWALDAADPDYLLAGVRDGCCRAERVGEERVEPVEAGEELERALLEAGLDVADGAAQNRRLEAVVGEPRARRANVLAHAGRAGRNADDSERARRLSASTMPMSGIRSMNEPLNRSAFQARDDSPRILSSVVRASCTTASSRSRRAATDLHRSEQEPMAGKPRVQSPGVVHERCEAARSGRQPDAGADRGDVVERVPDALELEQDRACAGELGRGHEAESLFARVRVRHGVCDPAACARAGDDRQSVRERQSFGRPLESAVLVEQARVDVEDQVADDVEPEVARLDHAGVDRPDRDLVRVGSAHGRRESVDRAVVVDEGPKRLVPVEAHAVEVVRLAFVPARGGSEVDDRRHAATRRGGRLMAELAGSATTARCARPARSSVWVACRLAKRQPSASAAATRSRYATPD